LFLSVDTTISESSIYADYIVPDVMYLDGQYGFMGQQAGACTAPHLAIRTPAIEPITGRTADGRPMCLETFLIDLALRLGLPGYGDRAIAGTGRHVGQMFPLRRSEDYYLRGIANVADNGSVPPATPEEVAWVEKNYPVAAYRDILTVDQWQRCAYLLARGGYFEPPANAWNAQGQHSGGMKLDPRAPLQIWHEVLATTREPMTGRLFPGTATYRPAEDGGGRRLDELDAEYPFQVVTFRLATRTKARTAYDYWALETHPLNFIEVNPLDADQLGLKDGERVRIVSPSGAAEATLKISQRVRPGVVAGTHHFGHTQQGNSPWEINGAEQAVAGGQLVSPVLHGLEQPIIEGNHVRPDPRRGSRGFNINSAMRRNDELGGTPLVDNAGGATVFLDSRVRLEKAGSL
jgi:tetrathionate reductase subunit A